MDQAVKQVKRRYVRLAASEWAEVEALWQAGEATLAELSERYGPSPRALQSHFSKAGIVKGETASALAATVREMITTESLESDEVLAERAKDTRERAYRNAVRVEELVMAQLTLAEHDPSQVMRVNSSLKALNLAAGALERLHSIKLRALGLDRADAVPDKLPVLEIVGLTEEQCERIRASHGDDDDFGGALISHSPTPISDGISSGDDEVVTLGGN